MTLEVNAVVANNALLGESPVWDVRRNCLHFVDILSSVIYSYYPSTGAIKTTPTPFMASAIAPCKDGRFIIATADGIYLLDIDNASWSYFVSPGIASDEHRYNDGKCDASGRFWIGSMHQQERQRAGALYVVESNQSYKKVWDNLTISNGLEWALDKSMFYYIDSETSSIKKYKYDAQAAAIEAPETIVTFSQNEGVPDGMTMDTEGMLWVAHFGGSCITRRHPLTGEILKKVEFPASKITSCCFGGDDLQDLYVTTAAKDLSEQALNITPQAGYTFVIRHTGCQGFPPNEFG